MTKTRNATVELTAFVPKHFPRTRLASGRVLSDAQQYQYDVLRTVGGKLIKDKDGWWRELSDTHRKKVFGLNSTAMFKLVELGLIECTVDVDTRGYMFLSPEQAKTVAGPRYVRANQIAKELAPRWNGLCPANKHGLDFEGQRCDLCPRGSP